MKRIIALSIVVLAVFWVGLSRTTAQGRHRLSMDLGWKFVKGDPAGAEKPGFDDSAWRTLDVPHDWSIEGEFDKDAPTGGSGGYLPTGIGWYRKHFNMPERFMDKHIWVQFDGVYMNSDVWINGHHLGLRPYGYISFKYDISPYLKEGGNVLAVRVDNSLQPNTRWYSGSGIYRHVRMTITEPLHVAHWGVYATTPLAKADTAVVAVQTTIQNDGGNDEQAALTAILFNPEGKEVARTSNSFEVQKDGHFRVDQQLSLRDPELWSVDSPSLYTLKTTVMQNGEIVDEVTTPVGIREIRYYSDQGFHLNGKPVKMHGVNLHHAGGPVGAAVPLDVWKRRLKELKAMGVNAIRTAHNPVAPEFLDLCDKMGFLVMNEAFDEWTIGKREYTYHRYFNEWGQRDLEAFIKRDRNHPSVVLWSAGNEIGEQTTKTGVGVLENLMGTFHQLDPTRPVTTGNDHIADTTAPTTQAFLNALDIVGYNYADRWTNRRELVYTPDKLEHPGWKMIGTESPNIYWVRDNYSLGDSTIIQPNYSANMIRVEQLWKYVAMHDFVIGDFMWTGIDYLGESFWPGKNAASGSLDLVGFKKDSYYFYQSQWTDKPMLHLFPHWNWKGREGQMIPVLAYTNLDAVDLYLNGKFIGERRLQFPRPGTTCGWNCYGEAKPIQPTSADLHMSWDVPYEPGVLKAVGKRDGKVVLTKEMRTAGSPNHLRLTLDRDTISANGRDVAHVKVEVVDKQGTVVPTASPKLTFSVEGAGRLIGIGNGNPVDHTSYSEKYRNAFHGKALGFVQAGRDPGVITIEVRADGLGTHKISIRTIGDGTEFNYAKDFLN